MIETQESLLRQLLAGQAAQAAHLDNLVDQVESASKDAREARDLSKTITTKLEEQNIIVRLGELKTDMGARVDALRNDVVAANTLLKKEIREESDARVRAVADVENAADALSGRVALLEQERAKVIGLASFFSWLARVAPWLITALAALAAGVGLEDKIKGG